MKEKLVVLTGPTAVGKTSVSVDLAKKLNGEIISADSMQIYKGMDIGTAKATKEEMKGVTHHLIDFVKPNQHFTVANYKEHATKLIRNLNKSGKLPIITGGTGLYINSIVYQLDFVNIPPNNELREELENTAKNEGKKKLLDMLMDVDPIAGKRYHVNDTQRIIRALEITLLSGKTIDQYGSNFRKPNEKYDILIYCLYMDRQRLYDGINKRVDLMIEKGLVDEVKLLIEKGYSKDLVSMKAIGYKEIIDYLQGEVDLDTSVEKIKKLSRNYAKRQLIWFRRDKRIKWIDIESFDSKDHLVEFLAEDIQFNLY